jgi:hypothetical protein
MAAQAESLQQLMSLFTVKSAQGGQGTAPDIDRVQETLARPGAAPGLQSRFKRYDKLEPRQAKTNLSMAGVDRQFKRSNWTEEL